VPVALLPAGCSFAGIATATAVVTMTALKTGIVIIALAVGGRSASADVTRCSSGNADLKYDGTAFQEMTGDTGWVPSGSVAQLRITGRLAGETKVSMGVTPTLCWPSGAEVTAPGVGGTGLLDFAYGGELHLYGQIHTSVLGEQIDWSGEIPVPLLPTDLMLANTAAFDPSLLPGGAIDHVSASDTTSPITVLSTDVIGDYIDIPGISGGLQLNVTGAMTTSYRSTDLSLGTASIAQDGANASVAMPASGSFDLPVVAHGVVTYAPSLIFSVAFDVKILGIRVVNWTLASVTMPLPQFDDNITLAAADAQLPLPQMAPLSGARVDFASGSSQSLAIQNLGQAPLMLEASTPPAGISIAPITIAPGQTGNLVIVATADAFAAGNLDITVATNDPSQPSVMIAAGTDIGGTSSDPAGSEQSGGCNAGRGAGLPIGLALLAMTIRRRRR
jgi:hypothetical protein